MKNLSSRKADREDHYADAIDDALFRVSIPIHCRKIREKVVDSFEKLVSTSLREMVGRPSDQSPLLPQQLEGMGRSLLLTV